MFLCDAATGTCEGQDATQIDEYYQKFGKIYPNSLALLRDSCFVGSLLFLGGKQQKILVVLNCKTSFLLIATQNYQLLTKTSNDCEEKSKGDDICSLFFIF